MDNVVILDLYTKKSYDDVGGKKGLDKMGIAIAGLFSYSSTDIVYYNQENIDELLKELFSSSLIVGFNLRKFILKILSSFSTKELSSINSLDILEQLRKKLCFKPTIEGLFYGTLNENKEIQNLNYIPSLYKQGKSEVIKAHCEKNILDVKKLYDYGRSKGYIYYGDNSGQRWKIRVDW